MSKIKLFTLLIMSSLINTGCMREINRSLTRHEARESYYSGNFSRSFRLTEAMAYEADPKSMYTLGYMYYYGIGAPINRPLGIAWIKEGAMKGYPPAVMAFNQLQHTLNEPIAYPKRRISEHKSVPKVELHSKNNIEATKTLALQGDANAQYTLGYMYYYGIEAKQDKALGISLIKQAAEKGQTRAIVAMKKLELPIEHIEQVVPIEVVEQKSEETNKGTVIRSEISEKVNTIDENNQVQENIASLKQEWSVQLGTFANLDYSKALVQKLKAQNLPVYTRSIKKPKANYTVVFVGPVESKAHTMALIADLKERFKLKDMIVFNDMKNPIHDVQFALQQKPEDISLIKKFSSLYKLENLNPYSNPHYLQSKVPFIFASVVSDSKEVDLFGSA